MKKKIMLTALMFIGTNLMGQDSTENNDFTFNGYADIYYSYDFNKPVNHEKPFFLYNHKRHNEFNVNLALLKASYNTERIRGNLGLMAGTYPQYNLSSEPALLQQIYEANAGIKISKSNLWIDVGILPSHIGYESAISKDNWTLTRSMAAENTPYYEAGAKITYTTKNNKILFSGMFLNGWQRIRRPDGNNTPAFGTQLIIKPNNNVTLNWSTFIGNDKPDSIKQWRYFNNLYGIFQLNDKWGLTIGFDIGQEQINKGSNKFNTWYSPTVVLRFTPDNNWAIAARGEFYCDKNGVVIPTNTINGFKTSGVSINVDRKINNNFWWRSEIRTLQSKDPIFQKKNLYTKNNLTATTSLTVFF